MSASSPIPKLPVVAIDVVMTTKRGRCYECDCMIYSRGNSYCCSLCSTTETPATSASSMEGKGVPSDYALICSSPVCVMRHSLRDQHTMCGCKTCVELQGQLRGENKSLRTYLVDPRCYCCNQLPGPGAPGAPRRRDEDLAFTIDGHGLLHRGHVWTDFSEASRYLTWCHECPSPPFDVKPTLFGCIYHYSPRVGSRPKSSRNETMRRFLTRAGERISLPSLFRQGIDSHDDYDRRLESFKKGYRW